MVFIDCRHSAMKEVYITSKKTGLVKNEIKLLKEMPIYFLHLFNVKQTHRLQQNYWEDPECLPPQRQIKLVRVEICCHLSTSMWSETDSKAGISMKIDKMSKQQNGFPPTACKGNLFQITLCYILLLRGICLPHGCHHLDGPASSDQVWIMQQF